MSTQNLNGHFNDLIDNVITQYLLPKKRDIENRLSDGFTEDLMGEHSLLDFKIAKLRTLQIYLNDLSDE